MKLLRQVWEQVRQDRLFSAIYIAGVALAIATTMVFAIVYYVKLAPVYPEYNRANTYIVSRVFYRHGQNQNLTSLSLKAVRELFYPIQNAETISAEGYYDGDEFIQPFDGSGDFQTKVRAVDPEFFKIFSYNFVEGTPLTDADLESGIHNAVITAGLADRIFGSHTGIVGQIFSLDNTEWRVTGVIEDPSALTPDSYGQIFLPYSTQSGYEKTWGMEYLGNYTVRIHTEDSDQSEAMIAELFDAARRYNASLAGTDLDGWTFEFIMLSFYQKVIGAHTLKDILTSYGITLLVLLMVPALNLSGIIAGRMESRMPEIGVRQSFGATRGNLLRRILAENLVLTVSGGIFGLILAEIAITLGKGWIFTLFEDLPDISGDTSANILTADMLFAPGIFLGALTVCLILNILAALIPAWWSLRHPITESLNLKK